MAKGYLVVTYRKINSPEKWGAYAKIAGVAIPKLGGKFIIRGMPVKTYEKGMNERVVSSEDEIILSWWDLMKPFILTMPPGAMNRPLGVYSTFIPAKSAQLLVNGEGSSAKVFPQERFGKPSSSCCLAWSESWTEPR